jgi:hypothetical protein
MLTISSGWVNKSWALNPIIVKQMSLLCMFLDDHLITHHSNMEVRSGEVTALGLLTAPWIMKERVNVPILTTCFKSISLLAWVQSQSYSTSRYRSGITCSNLIIVGDNASPKDHSFFKLDLLTNKHLQGIILEPYMTYSQPHPTWSFRWIMLWLQKPGQIAYSNSNSWSSYESAKMVLEKQCGPQMI